jgi:heme-degrading monooxygenase HmoA
MTARIAESGVSAKERSMIVVVFRSRLVPEAQDEYSQWAGRMSELAAAMPGHISHKLFTAQDGERLTLVEFASEESLRAWSTHHEHVQAKKLGRERFFAEYRVQVCAVLRDSNSRRR